MGYYDSTYVSVESLVGVTFAEINVNDIKDEIRFKTTDGRTLLMYHEQDCCESVSVEDIIGDMDDLIGEPLTMAEEVSEDGSSDDDDSWDESRTWTFYKFATVKGYVTIRWLGESNGYYSESVDLIELSEDDAK